MTKRDKEILEFVKDYMKKTGTTPTIREIGEGVGLYSTSSVYSHFQSLVASGDIIPVTGNSYRYSVKGMRYIDVSEGTD